MLEKINQIDTKLFLFLNGKHNSFFDPIMYWASHKWFWLPFYVFLVFIIIREFHKKSVYILIGIGILITLCDQTASNLIKSSVKRLRPSHELALQHLVYLSKAGPGGKYGFISSHSANVFGLATFLILLLPAKYNWLKIILLFWAILVAYSRIYNGVHYPLDVIVAMFLGIFYAIIIHFFLNKILIKKSNEAV
ncbi:MULTISPECIES: phosphatase PAP2 family protein [unclassified Flavobacterium]|uniref:phosphatase PAP2 family protein n=1 Tax=unclassified Flavobacterium TaxID=196869 RepID=UPI000F84C818|nr:MULTISPECIES: phosphatase PAP2 family protein [unclassified Flavobacterium]RTY67089.1 phosphatase PAP2 family protein [Flavobacterium sp. LB2P53]RTZ03096.1 phosphatase PAP2 family protein [Flavobacterium sp. GSP6]